MGDCCSAPTCMQVVRGRRTVAAQIEPMDAADAVTRISSFDDMSRCDAVANQRRCNSAWPR
ncbi:hypothetical protein XHC_0366 [Xanthomonas hortorum pv. carotae str. M081]|nr:hypothetical protein XHC_0366 [Xanthomonas hortorum pv. carotae str. M081]